MTNEKTFLLKYTIASGSRVKPVQMPFQAANEEAAIVFAKQHIHDIKLQHSWDVEIESLHEMVCVDTDKDVDLYSFDDNAVVHIDKDIWDAAWHNSYMIAMFKNPHDLCGNTFTHIIKANNDILMKRTSTFLNETEDVYCKITIEFLKTTLSYHINRDNVEIGVSPEAFAYISKDDMVKYFTKNNLISPQNLVRASIL